MASDATHDPALKSWVEAANEPGCDFPIQNLPFGVFRDRRKRNEAPRGGVAIGDQILDLAALGVKTGPTLNGLAAQGRPVWRGRDVAGNWKQHAWNYLDPFHIGFVHRAPGGLADAVASA